MGKDLKKDLIILKCKLDVCSEESKWELYDNLRSLSPQERYWVWIIPQDDKRTIPQNAYYWGVVLKLIEKETGTPAKELHELFKHVLFKEFFDSLYSEQEICFQNRVYVVPKQRSTATLPKKKFEELMGMIRDWADDFLGMSGDKRIPLPNEVKKKQLKRMITDKMI